MEMKKIFIVCIMMTMLTSSEALAQKRLTETEIKGIVTLMENNPRCTTGLLWVENESRLSYFLTSVHGRCVDDLEMVLDYAQKWHADNARIVQLEQQIYSKPGKKKCEQALQQYFQNPDAARATFAHAHQAEGMYERLVREITPVLEGKRNQVFSAPQGELTYFEFRRGGGMRYAPPRHAVLKRGKDGSYTVKLDTSEFDVMDTIAVTQAQVDTVRQMLIEGEVYKMPRYYDVPMMVFDAPSTSVSVEFTDASFSCNANPPSKWGGKNIYAVYKYLKALQKKEE